MKKFILITFFYLVIAGVFYIQCQHDPEYVTLEDFNSGTDIFSGVIIHPINNTASPFCYPNPAFKGDSAFVAVPINRPSSIKIEILDPVEIPVMTLFHSAVTAGLHSFRWDLSKADVGIHTAKVSISNESGAYRKILRIAVRSKT